MTENRFSREHGFEPIPESLASDQIPEWVREEIPYLAQHLNSIGLLPNPAFVFKLNHALREFWREYNYGRIPSAAAIWSNITLALKKANWSRVLDVCQLIYHTILEVYGNERASRFNAELNKVFYESGVAWRMDEDRFERVIHPEAGESIHRARLILAEPRFQAPAEQFKLALNQFNDRPEPNYKDSINNAIESVEGMVRIISGNKSGLLPQILRREPFKSNVHPTLIEALIKLYAFRGDETAHGIVEPFHVAPEEAELVLGMVTANIVYLANKFPKSPQEN